MNSTATECQSRGLSVKRLAPTQIEIKKAFEAARPTYWLRTDKLNDKVFSSLRRQKFEIRDIGSEDHSTQIYTVTLPGFTSAQAQVFALALNELRHEFMVALPVYEDESFERLVKTALSKTKRSDLPLFVPSPVKTGSRLWEFRPQLIEFTAPQENASNTILHAFARKKILRFVYPGANVDAQLTRRVRIRSIYGVNGVLKYFRGEYEGKIKTYSLEKCSQVIIEGLDVKHLLPTLAIEVVVTSRSKSPIIRLIQVAQL